MQACFPPWLALVFSLSVFAQATSSNPSSGTAVNSPDGFVSRQQIEQLHSTWLAERDPAKRAQLASDLVDAVIHDYDEQPVEVADDVARDGAPQKLLEASSSLRLSPQTLTPILTLTGAYHDEVSAPGIPVFRRMGANRLEAWIPGEGWLFTSQGHLLVDAHVPRRDGTGRDWFGAFLPNGLWITTDLWSNDRQLTCFDKKSHLLWELPGREIVAKLDRACPPAYPSDVPAPSIGWARVDRTGRKWLVCVGTDWQRGFASVTPQHQVKVLPANVHLWAQVYPRSMGVRGMFTEAYIDSDDESLGLHFSAAGHGIGVGWPSYTSSNLRQIVINGGNLQFGFWPNSHASYIEAERSNPSSKEVWFFDAQGKYQGEVEGAFLADAADRQGLLIRTSDGKILEIGYRKGLLGVLGARRFQWKNGSLGVPLAFYDDLHLGFFLELPSDADNVAKPSIVLARWN